ncbi:MAG TPA: hypothetical protein VF811_14585 [Parasulfuritortus sp.]
MNTNDRWLSSHADAAMLLGGCATGLSPGGGRSFRLRGTDGAEPPD